MRVIKSRRKRWAGRVACTWRNDVRIGLWWGKLREGDYFENLGLDRRIILEWLLNKWFGGASRFV
jgi:hypothetical protein